MRLHLSGLIPAVHTPMRADGSLHLDRIGDVVGHVLNAGASAIYAVGSTGEGPSLTTAERREVAQAYVTAVAGRVPVIVQVGHNSLEEARQLAAHAQSAGAAAISATPPHYFKPDSLAILVECMAFIAAATPDLPFYYYHIPSVTGVEANMVEFLQRGGETIPNLTGIKFTAPMVDEFEACIQLDGGRFNMLYGRDEMLLSGLAVGGAGAVGSTYNFALPLYRRLESAMRAGDLNRAVIEQGRAVSMIRGILRYGSIAAIKAMMTLVGVDCGPTRLPVRRLTAQAKSDLRRDMQELGFFDWAVQSAA